MADQNENKPDTGQNNKRKKSGGAKPAGEAKKETQAAEKPASTPRKRTRRPAAQNGQSGGQAAAPAVPETAAEAPKKRGRPKKQTPAAAPQGGKAAQPAAKQPAKQSAKQPAKQTSKQPAKKSGGRSSGRRGQAQPPESNVPGTQIKTAAQVAAAHDTVRTEPAPAQQSARRGKKGQKPKLRIIPLGGLGEVGKNLTVFECGDDALIVDCGLTFPDESMPGVDLVIPDFTYVIENKDKIRGIVLTHGHEDHIGGLPFLLKHVNLPLHGTRLTLGLIEGKLKEHGLLGKVHMEVQKPGDIIALGCMRVEFIGVNHSIPDACALALHTPAGIVVHTGDFKIDFTPIRGPVINLTRFGELGSQGVLALMADSTNAERPGSTASERTVGDSFDKLFAGAKKKRILVATFSSNVHRLQQIIEAAVKYKRKVAVSGRSMENVVNKALEIGYLDVPSGVLIDVDSIGRYPDDKVVIITTGSQGEPMSALTRMALGDHRKVTVTQNDCIIISATPIPGNEKLVGRVINELMRLGAEVVYERMYDIHVSGHACQDELKFMLMLTKPKFFVPVHGEFKHLKKHAGLAMSLGIDQKNIFIGDIGRVLETDGETMAFNGSVTAGKVLVDGLGVGDVGSVVLRDRKHLAQDGLIVVVTTIETKTGTILAGPDIVSRGFVYVRESEDMMNRTRTIVKDTINKCVDGGTREWGTIKQRVKDDVGDYLWQRTKRSPMILPVIQEVHSK